MRNPALLLPEKQFHRAMVRTQHLLVDDHIPDERKQSLGHKKIIKPPANASFTCCQAIRPPGILNTLRIQVTVHIHEAMIQETLDPGPFLWQEAGCPDILLGVLQVDRHMSGVEIPGNNEVFPPGMQLIAHREQVSIEIQLVLHTFHPALTAREVRIEQSKSRV